MAWARVVANAPAEKERPRDDRAARGALAVALGTLASKVVGLLRNRIVAHYFGTTYVASAVAMGFQVGNITQNLLGEGTLSATFIPIYAKLRSEAPEKATRFARAALGVLLVVGFFATVVFTIAAPLVAGVVANGFRGDQLALTIRITRLVFPMTGILVLGAWALGVLNAHRRFFLPYVAPVIWSLAQIGALIGGSVFMGLSGGGLAIALGWGAIGGAALQVLVMLPSTRRFLGTLVPLFSPSTEGVREAAARFPGAVIGRGIILLSGLFDSMLASFLGEGANAIFQFAQNLYLLPMALLGTGEAATALLTLSEHNTEGDAEARNAKMRDALGQSLARIAALSAVATAVFVALGAEVVTVVFQTGKFGASSTREVATVLGAYALALPGNAVCRVLTTASFAFGDTNRPARFAVARVVLSSLVSVALMRPLGVSGVVLGAVVAAWLELFLLVRHVRGRIGGIGAERIPFVRIAIVCAVTVATGLAARYGLPTSLDARLAAWIVLLLAGGMFAASVQSLGVLSIRSLLRR